MSEAEVPQKAAGEAADRTESVNEIIEIHRHSAGPLLPILHGIQDKLGYIPDSTLPLIAEALNLSRAEVHGVKSFYHYFRSSPPGRHKIQVCRAESCQAVGGNELAQHARNTLGIDFGETSADGEVSLDSVYCLGNCACSPSVRVGDDVHGDMNAGKFDALLKRLRKLEQAEKPFMALMSNTGRKIYLPRETTAVAKGAEQMALRIMRGISEGEISGQLLRNGSRGMSWLEPMLEVETPEGRVAFGPLTEDALEELIDQQFQNLDHPLCLGLTEEILFLKNQQRLTFARVGVVDIFSVDDYQQHGGFEGLNKALAMQPQEIVNAIKESGLRGRGGAAFPAGIKWQTVLDAGFIDKESVVAEPVQKYIVCNADEGDSGTYSDRMLMEGDPFCLIEAMIIAGLAVGADQGYIYLREEYPLTLRNLRQAIALAEQSGFLGDDIAGSGRCFNLEIRLGAGAYICGEETSLLESLEGKRGQVRAKPPLPAIEGLFGKPTLVHNVISLASVPLILAQGAEAYQSYGIGKSRGTLPFQLAGNIKYAGLVELAFGSTLRSLLEDFGGGTRSGKTMRAVQVGGPLGAYLPEQQWDTPLDYEAFLAIDAMLGHGGIVAFDDSVNMSKQARFAMEFCAIESCGKCTPCRIGSVRGVEVIDRIRAGEKPVENTLLLKDLCDTMVDGSLCAMGGMTPFPVRSALRHFAQDFGDGVKQVMESGD